MIRTFPQSKARQTVAMRADFATIVTCILGYYSITNSELQHALIVAQLHDRQFAGCMENLLQSCYL